MITLPTPGGSGLAGRGMCSLRTVPYLVHSSWWGGVVVVVVVVVVVLWWRWW